MSKITNETNSQRTPDHFYILNSIDQAKYRDLQQEMETIFNRRSRRNSKTADMEEGLRLIKEFCIRNDYVEDRKRSFVCGFMELNVDFLVNIENLKCLIPKCKSSINTTLRDMNINQIYVRCDACDYIKRFLPLYPTLTKRELRYWTIRKNPEYSDEDEHAKAIRSTYTVSSKKTKSNTVSVQNNESIHPFLGENVFLRPENLDFELPSEKFSSLLDYSYFDF